MQRTQSNHDYYHLLGCTVASTQEEIKRAYREKALQFHPDKCKTSDRNTAKFQSIQEAWSVLGHPQSRKEYDSICKQDEIDANSAPVYANILPDELEKTADDDVLRYPCRCGSAYYIERQHLDKKNCHIQVPCEECTFIVIIET